MIIPLRINLELSFKNRMIGFDYKGCKDKFRFNSDFDVASLFSYNIKARWNKIVNYGLNYSTIFFDYVFSTYGIIKRNVAIFINQINPEKRLKLFLKPGFMVNIFECFMPGKEFHNNNNGNSDYQINVSFTFETRALNIYLFKFTSLPQFFWLGNQINIDFHKLKVKFFLETFNYHELNFDFN
jgi:hypothetical protein